MGWLEMQKNMPLDQALQKYTLLSIGDGLVSQVPALIISVAAGLLVTRAQGDNSMGAQIGRQLGAYPRAVGIAACFIAALAFAPGMPPAPFLILGGITGFMAYMLKKQSQSPLTATGKPGTLALPAPGGVVPPGCSAHDSEPAAAEWQPCPRTPPPPAPTPQGS